MDIIIIARTSNPDFKKEWESLELEYQIQVSLMQARIDADMTQAELVKAAGDCLEADIFDYP